MNQKLILLPLLAQVLLTIIVSLRLVTARIREMRQQTNTPAKNRYQHGRHPAIK